MEHNYLQLNSAKTEPIMIGTKHQTQSTSIASITFSGHNIPLSSPVSNLGVKAPEKRCSPPRDPCPGPPPGPVLIARAGRESRSSSWSLVQQSASHPAGEPGGGLGRNSQERLQTLILALHRQPDRGARLGPNTRVCNVVHFSPYRPPSIPSETHQYKPGVGRAERAGYENSPMLRDVGQVLLPRGAS
ncbi:hypothetical protein AOLI_G00066830 [Acnodon oligacanthus]